MHTDKHTLSDPDLPDQLSFHLKLKSHGVNLNLKRNYQIDPNVDVYTVDILKDGLPILKKTHNLKKEDVAYYQDDENGAFMTARCVKRSSGQCGILINGNIQIGDKMYDLQPSEAQVTSRNFMETTNLLGKQYVLQDQGSIQRKMSVENKEERNVNEKNVEEEIIDRHRLISDVHDKQRHFLHPDVKLLTRNVASLHNAFATEENSYRTNSKNGTY
ncbi:hypothetical protein CHS0354_041647 [Potamilus streckersoni]|uniref:Uncharacterized protein n=1 Tax=Potamilus streckersoni TaxID=2493646 RepID=A0AAE0SCS6_9BIVA|nr:hypothetical protein CHS0354_041647 [Potamilus streckersoni]